MKGDYENLKSKTGARRDVFNVSEVKIENTSRCLIKALCKKRKIFKITFKSEI